ncbi:Serine/threonine protein phosphatase 2A 55 kDa regulatory subunit B beta [Abeliophyllum distichum]|uniref:Serine/threonine-protein phosphatase 2A 55 kDa regulatory subunit B n=1 Tax=Abeliophyllum distichum TaxID=126358 RepID=A0ABD1RZ06_9LAMI
MNGGDGGGVAAAPAGPPQPLDWKFSQVFGERTAGEEVQEVDIISAIEFDKTGDHLATGDRGGRVVLFERSDAKERGGNRRDLERMDYPSTRHPEFRYKTEFQSHEPEFDYLKSLEIEEKINKIRWCQTANGAVFLLSTNDKTIKFWKVQEKKVKKICETNADPLKAAANGSIASSSVSSSPKQHIANGGFLDQSYNCLKNDSSFPPGGISSLRLPVVVTSNETSLLARCRRIYAHAHDYHINSISNNSDGETFISADDLRINLWNLEVSNQSFNIVDVKPTNMEDLTEVITSAEFHPTHCNMLAYSSSKGSVRLIDLRQSALCDSHSKLFEEPEAPGSRSFFTEIIASISDIKFAKDGRHILSRDYMTLKLWDINMDSGPVATFQVHEYLRPKLCDLYENDSIFDKFECCLSGDGLRVATGSYSNLFRVFGCAASSTEATTLEASKHPMRRQVQTPSRTTSRSLSSSLSRVVKRGSESPGVDANGNSFDFTTKLLHLAWHPTENSIACAAANSLYMYNA